MRTGLNYPPPPCKPTPHNQGTSGLLERWDVVAPKYLYINGPTYLYALNLLVPPTDTLHKHTLQGAPIWNSQKQANSAHNWFPPSITTKKQKIPSIRTSPAADPKKEKFRKNNDINTIPEKVQDMITATIENTPEGPENKLILFPPKRLEQSWGQLCKVK